MRLDIETGQPTRDPALVLRLFDERIDALGRSARSRLRL